MKYLKFLLSKVFKNSLSDVDKREVVATIDKKINKTESSLGYDYDFSGIVGAVPTIIAGVVGLVVMSTIFGTVTTSLNTSVFESSSSSAMVDMIGLFPLVMGAIMTMFILLSILGTVRGPIGGVP